MIGAGLGWIAMRFRLAWSFDWKRKALQTVVVIESVKRFFASISLVLDFLDEVACCW